MGSCKACTSSLLLKRIRPYGMLLLAAVFPACDKESPVPPGDLRMFPIQSEHTGTEYEVQISLPEGHTEDELHPVMILLDAEWYMDHAVREAHRISGESGAEQLVIIGIGKGGQRKTDYTPTKTNEGDGGAAEFMRFLHEELLPIMERRHGVDTLPERRSIMGHSGGGLFAAYAFTEHNEVFGSYFLLSPSLWYDEGIVLRYEEERRSELVANTPSLFMSIGELERGQLFTGMLRDRMEAHYTQSRFRFYTARGKGKNSSAESAISEGMRYYFNP